jgi:hypothetical protein
LDALQNPGFGLDGIARSVAAGIHFKPAVPRTACLWIRFTW